MYSSLLASSTGYFGKEPSLVDRYLLSSDEKRTYVFVTIIDVYSRYIIGRFLSNTLDKGVCLNLVEESIKRYEKLKIMNSDQGSQFACVNRCEMLQQH